MANRLASALVVIGLLTGIALAEEMHLDRMVAVVNRYVITESEWQAQERFLALMEGKSPASIKLDDASLGRLMDRELILQQIENVNFARITPDEVAQQVHELRQQSGAADDKAWAEKLAEYGLFEDEFESFVADQTDVMRFIENRFRQNARATPEMVEEDYKQQSIPALLKNGAKPDGVPPLAQVREKIARVLVEQRVDEMLSAWLESLRNQPHVRRVIHVGSGDSAQAGTGDSFDR